MLAERNNSIITCKCQRVFVYALDKNLTTWKSKADACAYDDISIYFSLIPLVLLTASPPEKRHPHRMTEIEILEDTYVAQVASLFAGVVKNSVLPRWPSAAKTRVIRSQRQSAYSTLTYILRPHLKHNHTIVAHITLTIQVIFVISTNC